MLRLLRRELVAAEDVAAALLNESSAVVNLVPQTRHAPSGLEVGLWEVVSQRPPDGRRGGIWLTDFRGSSSLSGIRHPGWTGSPETRADC